MAWRVVALLRLRTVCSLKRKRTPRLLVANAISRLYTHNTGCSILPKELVKRPQ